MIGLFALPSTACFAGAAGRFQSGRWEGWALLAIGILALYKAEISK